LSAAGSWFDRVVTDNGTIPYDPQKPIVTGVSQPMLKSDSRDSFNTSTVLFNETVLDNINSLYQTMWYTHLVCCGNDDNGLITDVTITETLDAGSITDTVITY
jgi:hypothetical protein